jgi:hypothetical protein
VKKLRIAGQEIELEELRKDLDKLQAQASDVENAPVAQISEATKEQAEKKDEFTKQVLSEAGSSPKAALLLLSAELESNLREVLEATGWHGGRRTIPLRDGLIRLRDILPEKFPETFDLFLHVRNKLAHGYSVSNDDIIRAIDSGLKLLGAVQSIPREQNTVHATDVVIFSDAECQQVIQGVKGVMLETMSPDKSRKSFRIFPTTRDHFAKGEQVAWEWDLSKVWGAAWYRHPDTNEISQAWISSGEFVGKPLRR